MGRLYFIVALLIMLFTNRVQGQHSLKFDLLPIDKTDSLGLFLEFTEMKLTPEEKERHKLIWKIEQVRQSAISLKKKGVDAFTMTDESPTKESPYYIIGFYEMLEEQFNRLDTYRISKDLTIESYDFLNDMWTHVKH
ncbi:MAG: hypothetical protein ABI663_21115 [Chryseolinea sp.]